MKSEVLFLDGAIHKKTGSSTFFLDLLRLNFDVSVVYIEDLPVADIVALGRRQFAATIFWQVNPAFYINYFNGHNITFVPMYDAFFPRLRRDLFFLKDVKWLCFSRSYIPILQASGIRHLYTQYFPEPSIIPQMTEVPNGFFFWQRRRELDWNLIKQLLPQEEGIRVNVHRAVDPAVVFTQPSREDEEEYHISYSEWFDDKAELLREINRYRYYFAPRLAEGIGLSFLDAMATGRCVIAPDFPTMNEYVSDGASGLIYDPQRPQPIDTSRAPSFERIIEFVSNGRKNWIESGARIIDFVQRSVARRRHFANYQMIRDAYRPLRKLFTRSGRR